MIRGRHHNYIAWQLIKLHQQERDDTLDLARFMRISALLADCIEFVEKKNTGSRSHVVEQLAKSGVGFPEIAADQGIVAH